MKERMMKVGASRMMVSALALCIAACGGDDAPPPAAASAPIAAPSPTPSPSPSPSPTPTPTPTPTGGGTSSAQDRLLQSMLASHNQARAEVGTPDLVLDADLSRQALEYATEMARTGSFQHSPGSSRPNQGENLWAGTAGRFTHEEQAAGWIDEKQYYIHDRFPYVSSTGRWQDVGHYTQIIWRNTERLGCGIATGGNRDYVVCRYSPPGNVTGQFAY
ncbi:CAP domain-containing protein [uncultured Erythrobacter sp.]|uniref:CAP domain-containing protein n=1 Tax=uncultured Erythrobacter sp. TaxID=263913 RepID=UPI00262B991D|nr:CAP domain-containing protein [uncultured Erythrobacter sp.]